MLFIEEDQVIGSNYIANIEAMLHIAETMPDVGVVSGAYKSIQVSGNCDLLARPLYADAKHSTHDVYAWATTYAKWKIFFPVFTTGTLKVGSIKIITSNGTKA